MLDVRFKWPKISANGRLLWTWWWKVYLRKKREFVSRLNDQHLNKDVAPWSEFKYVALFAECCFAFNGDATRCNNVMPWLQKQWDPLKSQTVLRSKELITLNQCRCINIKKQDLHHNINMPYVKFLNTKMKVKGSIFVHVGATKHCGKRMAIPSVT